MLVAQALAPTVRSGNSGLLGEFRIESLTCPSKPDTASPTQLTSTGRGCSHQPGHPSQEFHISSAGASRTRALTTGSPDSSALPTELRDGQIIHAPIFFCMVVIGEIHLSSLNECRFFIFTTVFIETERQQWLVDWSASYSGR